MQDEIVSRLANALDAQLTEEEARRSERSAHPNSVDLYFQGKASWNKGARRDYMAQARIFFERALALDPKNIEAMVGMATVDAAVASAYLTDDRIACCTVAERNAIKRFHWPRTTHKPTCLLGAVYSLTNRAAQAIAECEQALALDHNLADAHACIGFAKYYLGRAAETEGHILEALRLSPRGSAYWMRREPLQRRDLR